MDSYPRRAILCLLFAYLSALYISYTVSSFTCPCLFFFASNTVRSRGLVFPPPPFEVTAVIFISRWSYFSLRANKGPFRARCEIPLNKHAFYHLPSLSLFLLSLLCCDMQGYKICSSFMLLYAFAPGGTALSLHVFNIILPLYVKKYQKGRIYRSVHTACDAWAVRITSHLVSRRKMPSLLS